MSLEEATTPVHTPTGEMDQSSDVKSETVDQIEKPLSPPLPSPQLPSEEAEQTTNGKHSLDDDDDDFESTKKIKLSDEGVTPADVAAGKIPAPTIPAPKPIVEPDMDNLPSNPMPKHQAKHALTSIKAVKRLKDAAPFLYPVDIVKLNIPFYYNYITRPMDLGTMEKKVTVNAYSTPEQLIADFNLMVANCAKFNGADSSIAQMGRNIQASFEKHMLNIPARDLPVASPVSKGRRKNTTPSVVDLTGVPTIRRESTTDGRPKREIHPPKPKDMPYDTRPRKKKFAVELRYSQQVIKELFAKKHESYSFPFVVAVDPIALDCPTYFDIVKEPMDLGTVQSKLSNNQYENGDDFERDVRLVFQNCYAFNPEGTPVNMMGHRLEDVFDKKWRERPIASPNVSSDEYSDESDGEIDESAIADDPAIKFLENQIRRMQTELEEMKRAVLEKYRKENKYKRRKSKKSKSSKKSSSSHGLLPANFHVTYEMKQELSEKIADLAEKKLNEAIAIIRENVELPNSLEEIELDMDSLDNNTLVRLYNFVVKKDKRAGRRSSSVVATNGSTKSKKKSKTMTDAEQSQEIENLKRKLEQFDRRGTNSGSPSNGYGNGSMRMNEDSSDEDDDASSESSEEE